ncbi:tRNA (adenosine(37)-N6)-threonylcarbamoyltransferase complex ATPase subunit type 1 TsaE [Sphingobacteriales bacterium UPWRP_1]|nr:tRNA (adenosine(37)-N6)-threonylcarbamoyltransferase complex ATPase subunit type 1 TsaE [Sphingobacteriales bacterium TSM_CSM]PSJ71818.1 tRNA (adenosine(37)-N6)-threonylcarbamoyltransferase complex ATPase subunit type 1 TsaE [Sphingobacteriales bacterium UPWRP_1]
MNLAVNSIQELSRAAKQVLQNYGNYRIFAVYGQMGAGKTTFIKELCARLHCTDAVSSPTFAIVNEYSANNATIYHLDLYRLKNIEEALDIGITDYLYSNNYCFIEWPEIIEPLLNPDETVAIHLSVISGNSRQITIQAPL